MRGVCACAVFASGGAVEPLPRGASLRSFGSGGDGTWTPDGGAKSALACAKTWSGATTFCSVSASAMDGEPLPSSKRILLLHITDVQNTGAEFTNEKMTDTKSWGALPYLAKTGSAEVRLQNANRNLAVYALASDSSRLRQVPARYIDGAYVFTAKVAAGEGRNAPTMMYELAQKGVR